MWLRELAGVITSTAVVTKIGNLRNVPIGKCPFAMQGWEYSAIPLAIPTGVTDLQLADRFGNTLTGHG